MTSIKKQLLLQLMSNHISYIREVLATVTSSSCPKSINLHCHTIYSDGSMQPEQLIDEAIKYNLNGKDVLHRNIRLSDEYC